MRRVAVFASIAAFSASVFAGPVAVWQGDGVRVLAYTEPCDVPEIAMILAQIAPDARKAAVQMGGREVPACYVIEGEKLVLVDAFGNGGFILLKDFQEAKGA